MTTKNFNYGIRIGLLMMIIVMSTGIIIWNNDQNKANSNTPYFLGTETEKHNYPPKLDSIKSENQPVDTTKKDYECPPAAFRHG